MNVSTPNEFLFSVEAARKAGVNPVMIDWKNARTSGKMATTYIPYKYLHFKGDWRPVIFLMDGVAICASVQDEKHRPNLPPQLTFRRSSVYKTEKTDEPEKLGEAMALACELYEANMAEDLKNNRNDEVEILNRTIKHGLQAFVVDWDGKVKGKRGQKAPKDAKKTALADPFIRVTMKLEDKKLSCEVYDLTKPVKRTAKERDAGMVDFQLATVRGKLLDNTNIHQFLYINSIVAGVLDFSSIVPHAKGTSLAAKVVTLMVKPAPPPKPFNKAGAYFGSSALSRIAKMTVSAVEEEEPEENEAPVEEETEASTESAKIVDASDEIIE